MTHWSSEAASLRLKFMVVSTGFQQLWLLRPPSQIVVNFSQECRPCSCRLYLHIDPIWMIVISGVHCTVYTRMLTRTCTTSSFTFASEHLAGCPALNSLGGLAGQSMNFNWFSVSHFFLFLIAVPSTAANMSIASVHGPQIADICSPLS